MRKSVIRARWGWGMLCACYKNETKHLDSSNGLLFILNEYSLFQIQPDTQHACNKTCTTWHIQRDLYNMACTTWREQQDRTWQAQHDTYNMLHTLWQVQHDVYRTMCSIWRVQHDMYNKMRTIWQVQHDVYNMKATKQSNDSMVMSISFLTSQVLVHSWLNVYFADW